MASPRRSSRHPSRLAHAPTGQDRGVSLRAERRNTWTVLYDAECGFCTWALSALLTWDRAHRLQPMPLQHPETSHLLTDIPAAERMASWHLISPTGARHSGGAAIPQMLRLLPGGRLPATAFAHVPKLTEKSYRWVADHRSHLSRLVPKAAKRNASRRVQERVSD